jgi:hypothetical protein
MGVELGKTIALSLAKAALLSVHCVALTGRRQFGSANGIKTSWGRGLGLEA